MQREEKMFAVAGRSGAPVVAGEGVAAAKEDSDAVDVEVSPGVW
jgi:hypothetical protein